MEKSSVTTAQSYNAVDNNKITQSFNESKLTIDYDNATNTNLRKELIKSKILISELQDKLEKEKMQRNQLEKNFNEAFETIKSLHWEYSQLTKIVEMHFNDTKIKCLNDEILKLKDELNRKNNELKEQSNLYTKKNNQLNQEIKLLMNKLNEIENQRNLNFSEDTEVNLIIENQKLLKNNKNLKVYIDNLKENIINLEDVNKDLNEKNRFKDKEISRQKEMIEKFIKANKQLSSNLLKKEQFLSGKINQLFHLNKLNTNKVITLQKQKTHLEEIILKQNPNQLLSEEKDKCNKDKKIDRVNQLNIEINSLREEIEKIESQIYSDFSNRIDTSLLLMSTNENQDYNSSFSN